MPAALAKILFIDDDTNLLAGVQRNLRREYDLAIADGAEAGVRIIESEGPFAVVVCDMQMPGMDGLQVLAQCERRAPDTVRIMMTGRTDQQTAITAINQGHIFRFLCKPCADADLRMTLQAATRQYRLQTAERELLEKTLAGSIRVLIDVLSLLDPGAYGRAARLRDWAREIGGRLALPNLWEIEMAALLSPLGQVAVPPEILARFEAGRQVSAPEAEMIARSPETARNLICNIPRMRGIADIVYYQNKRFDGGGFPGDEVMGKAIPQGARLLALLKNLARECAGARPTLVELGCLLREPGLYDPDLLTAVAEWVAANAGQVEGRRHVAIDGLREGQTLLSDILTAEGRLVLAAGAQLSQAQIERLHNLARLQGLNRVFEIEDVAIAKPAETPATAAH